VRKRGKRRNTKLDSGGNNIRETLPRPLGMASLFLALGTHLRPPGNLPMEGLNHAHNSHAHSRPARSLKG